jgi:hypothetical protein
MRNSGTTGTVVTYSFENDTTGEGGLQMHEPGSAMNLLEGNRATKFWADMFHGNTAVITLFRNHFTTQGVDLNSYHRWYNLIGNVINASVYKSVYSDATKYTRWSSVAFRLGYASEQAIGTSSPGENVRPDPVLANSTLLWENYVTAGASTRWLANEVPSSDPVFPNPVPANQNLPASFYLSARPSWWPVAKAWPPIGPDVTGGNVTGYGGHAYTIPAQDCYVASGSLSNFNPNVCYASGALPSPPSSPTGLRILP